MGRLKNIYERFEVALNKQQSEALAKLMHDDMQSNKSPYIGILIAEVVRRREAEKINKRPVGRPVKKDDDENPDDDEMVLHPDQLSIGNKGRYITKSEYNLIAPRYGKEILE
jgi:hypothetical protein